ncbi:hypothetical protein R1sor_016858 [Riccia sorocarpa]|uniref:Complex 1 LYR protein domain-containing protein n=1 Tax=Riccia sorocarpa TaxID=122646 RepID=A0ABD3HK45_9MARC
MATAGPSPAEAKALFKAFLREARKFPNYNIREYVKRRAKEGFRECQSITDPSAAAAAFADGKQQLEVAKRQSIVYISLCSPSEKYYVFEDCGAHIMIFPTLTDNSDVEPKRRV